MTADPAALTAAIQRHGAAAMSRYTLEELRFIAARVIAEVRATPPEGPLLGETPPRPKRSRVPCQKLGHAGTGRAANGLCRACDIQRKRAARRRM